jgi:hypothetical protein
MTEPPPSALPAAYVDARLYLGGGIGNKLTQVRVGQPLGQAAHRYDLEFAVGELYADGRRVVAERDCAAGARGSLPADLQRVLDFGAHGVRDMCVDAAHAWDSVAKPPGLENALRPEEGVLGAAAMALGATISVAWMRRHVTDALLAVSRRTRPRPRRRLRGTAALWAPHAFLWLPNPVGAVAFGESPRGRPYA